MKKLKQNIKNNMTIYTIFLLVSISLFGVFAINRYIQDTYVLEYVGLDQIAISPNFYDGRWFASAFFYLMYLLKIPVNIVKFIAWIEAIFCITISMILMYNVLEDFGKNKILRFLLSCGLVANPFVIELFMFPECTGTMCLSLLFVFISIFNIYKYFKTNKKSNLIISFINSSLSCMCYQATISLLIIIPFAFCLKFSKNFWEFIKKSFLIGCVYAFGTLSNICLMKILGSSKLASQINIMENIKIIKLGLKNLFITTCDILPDYFLLSIFLLTLLISVISLIIENRKQIKKLLLLIVFYFLTLVVLFIVPLIPQLVVVSVWMTPRSCLGYGLLAIFPILIYIIYTKNNIKLINYFYIIVIIVLLSFQFVSASELAKGQIEINAYTNVETQEVMNVLEKYESKNNIKVTKMVAYNDQIPTIFYSDTRHFMDVNIRQYSISWAYNFILSLKTGNKYEVGLENEEMKKYCQSKNWKQFAEEQINFVDDTMYVCMY